VAKTKVTIKLPKVDAYLKSFGLLPKDTVQKLIDLEVMRLSDKYAPSDLGGLRKSVWINTDVGSGEITYDIYGNSPGRNSWNDTTSRFQDAPIRGPFWVIRMWDQGGKEKIMLAVKRFLSRK